MARPSPLQNRVTPFGDIVADVGRGMFLGNRGCLVDEPHRLATRRWRLRAWITCRLHYKDWWRPVMQPGVWTELFFLDEATALAAGHRPCALRRRGDYNAFVEAWQDGNGWNRRPRATEIDDVMHRERTRRDRSKVTFEADAGQLPDGTMIVSPDSADRALLISGDVSHPWSPGGFGSPQVRPAGTVVVLTPRSTVAALTAGFRPKLHGSVAPDR